MLLFAFFWCKIWELNISCTSVFPSSFASSSELHIKGGLKEIPHKRSESALEKNQQKHQTYASILIVAFLLQIKCSTINLFFGKVHNCLKLTHSKKTFSIPFFQLGGIFFTTQKTSHRFFWSAKRADFLLSKWSPGRSLQRDEIATWPGMISRGDES